MGRDASRMWWQKLVDLMKVFNPSAVSRGSKAATSSAAALSSSKTAFDAGVLIWNADALNYVTIGTGSPTDGPGDDKIVLGAGQGYWDPVADLSTLSIVAATGTPVVSWIGMTK